MSSFTPQNQNLGLTPAPIFLANFLIRPLLRPVLLAVLMTQTSIAFGSSARPRVDTEAWDIKETTPADPNSTFTMKFRLTFGQTHQRVFFATMGSKKSASGVLTQESRTGHTAASIDAAKAGKIAKQLSDFTTETKYARPGKYWSCQYPLDFTFAQKTTLRRCQEMLSPQHKKSFSKIVSELSLESKR